MAARKAAGKKSAAKSSRARKSSTAKKRAAKSPGAPGAGGEIEALRAHMRVAGHDYLKLPGVTSVGVGLAADGESLEIQFTVSKLEAAGAQREALGKDAIPDSIAVGDAVYPTRILKRDYEPSYKLVEAQSLGDRRMRIDPIVPGVSVAHENETAGTIGLIVFDRETSVPCILSNWHVLHGNSGAVGDRVLQPGPFDDNNVAGNETGELLRSHLGAAGDCAIARIRGRDYDRKIYELGVTPTKMANVDLGDRVVKSGRTTGVTFGVVRRVEVMAKIDYGPPAGERVIGGFEIGVDRNNQPRDGEVSQPGDSGSAWLIANGKKATDIFAGLHFAGEARASEDEHALACYPLSVQKKLDFTLEPPADAAFVADGLAGTAPRAGFDDKFLGLRAPAPTLNARLKSDAVTFNRSKHIPYTHFSVCLSEGRRMARYVAWNVDGARLVRLPRRGFKIDPRVPARHQIGNDLYEGNALDRGHIARRADVCWGPVDEADQANRDSFFYTNIAPQHERYNQSDRGGLWGELENLVFDQAEVKNLRLSVLGGPIFGEDDTPYRGALVPKSFWKLIAYVGADDRLRCAAFVLSQEDLVRDLETIDFDPFRLHQVTVSDLAARTDLGFAAYEAADVVVNPELAVARRKAEALRKEGALVREIDSAAAIIF